MTTSKHCFIGFGGNTGNPIGTFSQALKMLATEVGPLVHQSPCYITKPLNPPELQDTSQPDFHNMVAEFQSELEANEILTKLLSIERLLGRDRRYELRWGPRKIDLDLLLVEDCVIETDCLSLPHPRMLERDFVLQPLCDIAANVQHPTTGKTVRELLADLHKKNTTSYILTRLEETDRKIQ